MGKFPHYLIGVIYNRNGIATWCIEAARALKKAGCKVHILAMNMKHIPDDLRGYALLVPPNPSRNLLDKIKGKIQWWMQFFLSSSFNSRLFEWGFLHLEQSGNRPDLLLVAQTDFLWPEAPVPQWVVARSWPLTLAGYLQKMNTLKSQPWLSRLHDLIFWHKMDHQAYRAASGVIGLTNRLTNDLKGMGIRTTQLYPCVMAQTATEATELVSVPRFFSAALNLEDKRKNISCLVDALSILQQKEIAFECTLSGQCSPELMEKIKQKIPQVKCTGMLGRGELQTEMAKSDIFLFASLQENWGYVLIEAMAMGLLIFTPDMYPFDEINTDESCRFEPGNAVQLAQKLEKVILDSEGLKQKKKWVAKFYADHFSPEAFAEKILTISQPDSN